MTRTAATPPTLHFVYNVDGTPLAVAMDFVHRLVSPETYPCRLCDLTYGRFVKRRDWRQVVAALPFPSRFHLRNTFLRRFPGCAGTPLPAVFLEEPGAELRVLIPADELKRVRDLDELGALVRRTAEALRRQPRRA